MPLVVSLTVGTGCLLLMLALTAPRRPVTGPAAAAAQGARPVHSRTWADLRGRAAVGALAGALAAVVAQAALGWPSMSLAAGVVGALLPAWHARRREEGRREALGDAIAAAVDALRDGARVGIGIEEGLRGLAQHGPDALRPALRRLMEDLRYEDFEEAMKRSRDELAHPAWDMVAAALVMSYRVGGRHLSTVLDGLGRSVRGTARARREVRAQQAEQLLSARVIALMPVAVIVAIKAGGSGYLDVFALPAGQATSAACVALLGGGYLWMRHITEQPGQERVLR